MASFYELGAILRFVPLADGDYLPFGGLEPDLALYFSMRRSMDSLLACLTVKPLATEIVGSSSRNDMKLAAASGVSMIMSSKKDSVAILLISGKEYAQWTLNLVAYVLRLPMA